jgi:hypothetical protein
MHRLQSKRLLIAVAAVGAASTAATLALGITPAMADQTNSPGASVGTANCGSAGTFSFVVAGGNGHGNGTPFNPAFLSDGVSGVFIPTDLDLTFVGPPPIGTFVLDANKGNVAGTVTCTITGHSLNAPITFSGTAVGNIVTRR